jgi:hypothetical protein
MKARILFAFFAGGIGMLLAHAPPAQPHRIGPAEISPDPGMRPGTANPQVTQRLAVCAHPLLLNALTTRQSVQSPDNHITSERPVIRPKYQDG